MKTMKHVTVLFTALAVFALLFTACENPSGGNDPGVSHAAFIHAAGWKCTNAEGAEFVVTFTDTKFTYKVTNGGSGGFTAHVGKGFTITFSSVIPVSGGTSPYANGFTFTGTLSGNTVDWTWNDDDASNINGQTGGTFKFTWYMHDNGGSIKDKQYSTSIFNKQ